MLILLCFQFSIFSFLPTPECFSFLQPSGDSWKSESRIGRSSQTVCNALIAGQRRSFRATFSLLNIAYLSFPRYTCTVSSKTKTVCYFSYKKLSLRFLPKCSTGRDYLPRSLCTERMVSFLQNKSYEPVPSASIYQKSVIPDIYF